MNERQSSERKKIWYAVAEDRDFRDLLVGFMAETKSEFTHMRGALERIENQGCAHGPDERAKIKALEESDGRQWKAINRMNGGTSVKKGAIIGASGLGLGGIIAMVKQIVDWWTK